MHTKMIGKSILLATLLIPCATLAATRTWTGDAGDHMWNTAGNWSGNALPTWGDKVAFDSPGDTLVLTDGAINQCRFIDVLQGDVYIGSTSPKAFYFHGNGAAVTNIVNVVAGSTLVISNNIVNYSGDGANFRKIGGGVLSMRNRVNNGEIVTANFDSEGRYSVEIVEGGISNAFVSSTYGVYFGSPKVHIHSGAFLYQKGYNAINRPKSDWTIDKGAKLQMHMYGSADGAVFGAIRGEGTIEAPGNSGGTIKLTLYGGPCTFSGEIKNPITVALTNTQGVDPDDFKFILGASNVLSTTGITGLDGIAFAPGIGAFAIDRLIPSSVETLATEDAEGNPIRLKTKVEYDYAAKAQFTGGGTLDLTVPLRAEGNMFNGFFGALESSSNSAMDFGTGSVDDTLDISGITRIKTDGRVTFKNYRDLTLDGILVGKGEVKAAGPGKLTLANVERGPSAGQLISDSEMKLASGDFNSGYWGFYSENGGDFTISGGRFYAGKTVNGFADDKSVLKTPDWTQFYPSVGSKLRIEGGEVYLSASNSGGPDTLELAGGKTVFRDPYKAPSWATAENPAEVVFDGGEMVISSKANSHYHSYPFADNQPIRYAVGAGGVKIDVVNAFSSTQRLHFYPELNGSETDGGLTRWGTGQLNFYRNQNICGPFRLYDGWNEIQDTADVAGHPDFFGTGDFEMGNAQLTLPARGTPTAISLGTGDGASFRTVGAATISCGAGWDVTLGPLTRTAGGTLDLRNTDGNPSAFRLPEAPEAHPCGALKFPVFMRTGAYNEFLSWDAEASKLVPFANHVAFSNAGAGDIVFCNGGGTEWVPANSEKFLLGVTLKDWGGLGIHDGATLHLGNGTDPAAILFNYEAWFSADTVGGGTLDFGTSEGIIQLQSRSTRTIPNLKWRITGSNGVSVNADSVFNHSAVRLMADNPFTGDLRVNGAIVAAAAAGALGRGKVIVGGGDMNGGRIVFETADVFDNDFEINGRGPMHIHPAVNDPPLSQGALSFDASATVAGSVKLSRTARISPYGAGVEAKFRGVISGDALEVWSGSGEVILDAANTYTGDTHVYQSVLALTDDGTAGDGGGEIQLDNGVLKLRNVNAKTVANAVAGVGTIRLAGKGEVNIPSIRSQDGAGFKLDLARKVTKIRSLNGISEIATGRTAETHLVVGDGSEEGFAGNVPANVTLHSAGWEYVSGCLLIVR